MTTPKRGPGQPQKWPGATKQERDRARKAAERAKVREALAELARLKGEAPG